MAITLNGLLGLPETTSAAEARTALQALTIQELLDTAQRATEEGMRSTAARAYRWLWRIISPDSWDIVPTADGLGYMVFFGGMMLCEERVIHPKDLGTAWDRANLFLEEWFFATYPLPLEGYPLDLAVAA